ncbi:radical SAM protein [uncultured Alistipes sp.]|uniref:radical SAM protein n=2 Tax=uncultured Alistipes sp. TaxID=538949 RepID=UPI0026380A37|nr:radical SAM protein [uncultured Alistipes sp.]
MRIRMDIEKMHFTGPIWRPPYEAGSVLLQATVGCTHHRCKFCSLYPGIEFRVSPMSEIVSDLEIIRHYQPRARRVFLTGANPFALSFDRLKELAMTVHDYLPRCRIGTFSRISDIKNKTVEQLKELRSYGFNGLSIGTETGDDMTLAEMNKGNTAQDTFEQCRKLEEAGIEYYIVYLTGLAGKGNGRRNALASAKLFSRLKPYIISVVSLTLFPGSELYGDVANGNYTVSPEHERLEELMTFIGNLENRTTLLADTVSNPVPINGFLPEDKNRILAELRKMRENIGEAELQTYRRNIRSL